MEDMNKTQMTHGAGESGGSNEQQENNKKEVSTSNIVGTVEKDRSIHDQGFKRPYGEKGVRF